MRGDRRCVPSGCLQAEPTLTVAFRTSLWKRASSTQVHVEGENIPVSGQHQTTLETALGIEASRMGRRPGVEDGVKA